MMSCHQGECSKTILCVQLTEAGSTTKVMGYLNEGRGLVMLLHNGLVQVL